MKSKFFAVLMLPCFVFYGCESYTGSGAYMGSSMGAVLGSAIGGMSNGARGSDIGTIIGMAGGAVIGGAIGNAKDRQIDQDREDYVSDMPRVGRSPVSCRRDRANGGNDHAVSDQVYDSGFDSTNSGDDRLYDFNPTRDEGKYRDLQPDSKADMRPSVVFQEGAIAKCLPIEIRHARFVDENDNGMIERGELCKIVFEAFNKGEGSLYDVHSLIEEATGSKHIFISPGLSVDRLKPGSGIRYTALVKADRRLKNGMAVFRVSLVRGAHSLSMVVEFKIPTRKL